MMKAIESALLDLSVFCLFLADNVLFIDDFSCKFLSCALFHGNEDGRVGALTQGLTKGEIIGRALPGRDRSRVRGGGSRGGWGGNVSRKWG